MTENKEKGVRDDPAPLADPLRGDDVAKRRALEEDGDEKSSKKQKVLQSAASSESSIPAATESQLKLAKKVALSKSPIAIKFGTKPQKPKEPDIKPSKSLAVAKVFGDDSDDEEEEMPPEAKMRMKNRGRGTPTSAGPNSFNKSRDGFINTGRAWRLKKEEEIAKAEHEKRVKEQKQSEGWDA